MEVIIMRGVPGSGKSTWIARKYFPTKPIECSADHYFIGKNGEYKFNPALIGNAHLACMDKFLQAIHNQPKVIIVDNTNTQLWEFSGYLQVANARGYKVTIVEVMCDLEVAAARNIHGVPAQTVKAMAARWEEVPSFWACKVKKVGETTFRTNADGHDI